MVMVLIFMVILLAVAMMVRMALGLICMDLSAVSKLFRHQAACRVSLPG